MRIKIEPGYVVGRCEVKIQIAEGKQWYDFGLMNYIERKELADQLRNMAKELMEVK